MSLKSSYKAKQTKVSLKTSYTAQLTFVSLMTSYTAKQTKVSLKTFYTAELTKVSMHNELIPTWSLVEWDKQFTARQRGYKHARALDMGLSKDLETHTEAASM